VVGTQFCAIPKSAEEGSQESALFAGGSLNAPILSAIASYSSRGCARSPSYLDLSKLPGARVDTDPRPGNRERVSRMNRKLTMLVIGGFAAFACLAPAASASAFTATCSGGELTCFGTIQGTGSVVLEESSGLKISCTGTTGSTQQSSGFTWGSASFRFSGCKESVLGTNCGNTAESGQIQTNTVTSDLIYIESKSTPGVLLTGLNVTFSCPTIGVKKTVTGNIIGHIENPACGTASASHTISFEAGATTGTQKYTEIETASFYYDLTVNNDAGGSYATSSLSGTSHVSYLNGRTLTLNC